MPYDYGELEALGAALDVMKQTTEKSVSVYKHAMNKKVHYDGTEDSYDPAVAHFLEEELIESYTDDIRTLAGHVNLLAKIARNDKTRAMGLHLYDQNLR